MPGLNDPPLHDARVFAASGDEVAVVTEEIDVGHVTAVPTVHVAGSLGKNDMEGAERNAIEAGLEVLDVYVRAKPHRAPVR